MKEEKEEEALILSLIGEVNAPGSKKQFLDKRFPKYLHEHNPLDRSCFLIFKLHKAAVQACSHLLNLKLQISQSG